MALLAETFERARASGLSMFVVHSLFAAAMVALPVSAAPVVAATPVAADLMNAIRQIFSGIDGWAEDKPLRVVPTDAPTTPMSEILASIRRIVGEDHWALMAQTGHRPDQRFCGPSSPSTIFSGR